MSAAHRGMNDGVRRLARAACALLVVIGASLGTWWFFTHWDPTRIIWKRLSRDDPYRYERTDPRYLAIDLAALVRVTSATEVDTRGRNSYAVNGVLPRQCGGRSTDVRCA